MRLLRKIFGRNSSPNHHAEAANQQLMQHNAELHSLLIDKTRLENSNSEQQLQIAQKNNVLMDGVLQVAGKVGALKLNEANLSVDLVRNRIENEQARRRDEAAYGQAQHTTLMREHEARLGYLAKGETRNQEIHQSVLRERSLIIDQLINREARAESEHQVKMERDERLSLVELDRANALVKSAHREMEIMDNRDNRHAAEHQAKMRRDEELGITLHTRARLGVEKAQLELRCVESQEQRLIETHQAKMERDEQVGVIEQNRANWSVELVKRHVAQVDRAMEHEEEIHESKMEERKLMLELLTRKDARDNEVHLAKMNHQNELNLVEMTRASLGVKRAEEELKQMKHDRENKDMLHSLSVKYQLTALDNLAKQETRDDEEHQVKMDHRRETNMREVKMQDEKLLQLKLQTQQIMMNLDKSFKKTKKSGSRGSGEVRSQIRSKRQNRLLQIETDSEEDNEQFDKLNDLIGNWRRDLSTFNLSLNA